MFYYLVTVKCSRKAHFIILGLHALLHELHLVEAFSETHTVLKNKFSTRFDEAHHSHWGIFGLKVVKLIPSLPIYNLLRPFVLTELLGQSLRECMRVSHNVLCLTKIQTSLWADMEEVES